MCHLLSDFSLTQNVTKKATLEKTRVGTKAPRVAIW